MDYMKTALAWASVAGAQKAIHSLNHLHATDVLHALGLERDRTRALPALGLVLASAVVGAGAALLLTPRSGAELRARLTGKLENAKRQLAEHRHEHPYRESGVSRASNA